MAKNMECSKNKQRKYAADLEEALEIAGIGWFNLTHSAVLVLCLITIIMAQFGPSVVLPAATCDLKMTDRTRGLVISLPYMGFFLTSFAWGYLVDTRGRKKTLIFSSFIGGFFSIMAGFTPDFMSFAICNFLSSLCWPCLAAVPFTFVAEILPNRYKDTVISVMNGLQMIGSLVVPPLAWAILPLNFRIDFGVYDFRPWRLLNLIYSSPFIIAGILMCFYPESPKYLVSQNKCDEALRILQVIYARNKGKIPAEFPIDRLTEPQRILVKGSFLASLREQSAPFLKWMYLKWMILIGFQLIGIYSIINGLYIWVPDVINRVAIGGEKGKTACQVIKNMNNQTSTADGICHDNIDEMTLFVNTVGQAGCTLVIVLVSATVRFIGKKSILIIVLGLTGLFCILINFITNEIVMTVLLLLLPMVILGFGSVNAYIVEIIPIQFRGVALTVSLMIACIGSISTSTISGFLINGECEAMFYLFGGLLLLCSALSFLFPNTRSPRKCEESQGHCKNVT